MKKTKKRDRIKTKLWEKIFVISSIAIIFIITGVYAYRLIYYYHDMNYIPPEAKLIDVITNQKNIVYTGEGLYKNDDNTYYYNGINVNNYILFSGRIWRIIGIDKNGIELITDNNETTLVWGSDSDYENSIIYKWLNNDVFLKSLSLQEKINKNSWCNTFVDINKYNCDKKVDASIGLLTTSEYLKAGGVNSYLNIGSYFWTLNTSEDKKAYYIHNEGGINNDIGHGSSLYSYGVRPVIYLKSDINYITGDGTKENPYIIDKNNEVNISKHPIGSYISYSDYIWRIIEINDEYTKVIMDDLIKENEEKVKVTYDNANSYLNNTFINNLNKDDLVGFDSIKTEFNLGTGYEYNNTLSADKSYVSLPVVGNLFTSDYDGYWLNTYYSTSQKLVYTASSNASLLADLTNSENYLRPVIALKNDLMINKGEGTKENPYVLGGNE